MSVSWYADRAALDGAVRRRIERVDTVLDIGCGIQPQDYVVPQTHICCEPFGQYVDYLMNAVEQKTKRIFYDRRYVVLNLDWGSAVRVFPPRSVDAVYLTDVVEHLEKDEGLRLLNATTCVARRQVVVFTPLGFLPQHHPDGRDAWGLDGGHMQEHKSGWVPEDFDDTWEVFACRNFHLADNLGRQHETPFGAFYAIRTTDTAERTRLSFLQRLDLQVLRVVSRFGRGRELWARVKRRLRLGI